MLKIERRKWTERDGTEHEFIYVSNSLNTPEEAEQFGRDLLQAATEWRAEIEARGPPGPPAYKVFDFISWAGGRNRIASWIEHPWALVRVGKGTSIAFLVKERDRGDFQAWIVSAKFENGEHQWKCRFGQSSIVAARDLLQVIRRVLPDSPTLGDIEHARRIAAGRRA